MALSPGTRLGPYSVEAPIGAGGMGEVYRARDLRLGREVALKVLPPDAVADADRQRRFLQEARAASSLNHPHIVTIHDVIHEDGLHAIVMELVEGRSLQEMLADGPLPVSRALKIGRQIADALAAAHGAGIVHRDLKPANVIVTPRGQTKVLDFGIAKLDPMRSTDTEGTRTSAATMMGAILGTAAYMSPEQARGEPLDARSDIFSLGVVMYELLSGRSPFAGPSITAVLHKLLYEEPLDLALQGTPPAVTATLERMLAKKAGERYQSMDAVMAALDAVTAGQTPPPPDTAVQPPVRLERRRAARQWVIAGSVLALAIVAALLVWKAPWRAGSGPPSADPTLTTALPATAFEAYQAGQALLARYDRDGYIDRSIEAFKRAGELQQDYSAAYAGLGLAYWRKYRDQRDRAWLEQAYSHAKRAVEIDPRLTVASVALANVEAERGDYVAAATRLDDAELRDPANADLFAARAHLYVRQARFDDALDATRNAVKARPGDWSLSLLEGVILMLSARHAEAVASLERASREAPDSALVFRNLGAAYHGIGEYAKAVGSFQRALEIKADPSVHANLGTAYFFQGMYGDARNAFEAARVLRPNDFRQWSNVGDAYRFLPGSEQAARESYTRGLQLLDEQIKASPGNIDLTTRRVVMLAKRGGCAEARTTAAAEAAAAAGNAAALYRLGVAHEVCGGRDAAVPAILAALDAGYPRHEIERDPELVRLREDLRYHRYLAAHPDPPGRRP